MKDRLANLLPKEQQKDIKLEKASSKLVNLIVWAFLSLVVLLLLSFAAKLYLQSELKRVTDRVELQKQVVSQGENQELKIKLKEFNGHLDNLVTLSDNHAIWSEVVIEFARVIPEDVAIDNFLADRKTGQISITGFAKFRDSVLDLRNNLVASEYFENVNFPLANLVRPEDVNFRYKFFVNNDELIK